MQITMKKFFLIVVMLVGIQNQSVASIMCSTITRTDSTYTDPSLAIWTITMTYPLCMCVGDVATIDISFSVSNTTIQGYALTNFAPLGTGSTAGLQTVPGSGTGPNPALPGSAYFPISVSPCVTSGGQGNFNIPEGVTVIGGTSFSYALTFQVEATAAGVQSWYVDYTAFNKGSISPCQPLFANMGVPSPITINVTPRATTPNGVEPLTCQNAVLEATLPLPGGTIGLYTYAVDSADAIGGTVVLTNPSATGGSTGAGAILSRITIGGN
jgi:hypothetical protein